MVVPSPLLLDPSLEKIRITRYYGLRCSIDNSFPQTNDSFGSTRSILRFSY